MAELFKCARRLRGEAPLRKRYIDEAGIVCKSTVSIFRAGWITRGRIR